MTFIGYSFLQASNQLESNLTQAIHRASVTDLELSCNPINATSFMAIGSGDFKGAGEIAFNLHQDGQLTPQYLVAVKRAIQASPNPMAATDFCKTFNDAIKKNSPTYKRLEALYYSLDTTEKQRKEYEKKMEYYLNK